LAKERKSTKLLDETMEEENFYDVVKAKDEEAKRRKEERARKRKERKMMKRNEAQEQEPLKNEEVEEQEAEEVDQGGIDPTLAAMMGFSGFGSGNKNG
jgi:U4/U6.U5 tri-snRNP component SNU23